MSKHAIFAVAALLLLAGLATGQEKKKAERPPSATAKLQLTQCALKVSGMVCDGCAGMVKQGLLKLDGVKAATVDYKTGEVQVGYDAKKTSPDRIVAAFNEANRGFRAELPKPKGK